MSGKLSDAELAGCFSRLEDPRYGLTRSLKKIKAHINAIAAENERLRQRLLTAAGDDLCRLTQEEIKDLTGGKVPIPPKAEFLGSCDRFHSQIDGENGVNQNCLTLAQLVAENERLTRERNEIYENAVELEVQRKQLREQLAAAQQRLAALAADPTKRDELVESSYAAFKGALGRTSAEWPACTHTFRTAFTAAVEHAFARGRASLPEVAELEQQIAELKAGLETLGPKVICQRTHYDAIIVDRDRHAAELAATKQALAAARGDVERVRAACEPFKAYADEIPAEMPEDYVLVPHELTVKEWRELKATIEAAPSPAPAKPAASEPNDSSHTPGTAHASSSQSEPADHSGEAGEKVEPAERRFVCPRCGCNKLWNEQNGLRQADIDDEEDLQCGFLHCEWHGRWAEVEAAKGKGEATESPQPDPRTPAAFRCPKCDSRYFRTVRLTDGLPQLLQCKGHWNGQTLGDKYKGCSWQGTWDEVRGHDLIQQLAAANQAREAERQRADKWEGEVMAITTTAKAAGVKFIRLGTELSVVNLMADEQRQRAEAAEAAAGEMQEALGDLTDRAERARSIVRYGDGGNWGMLDTSMARKALAATPGQAANELRALRAFLDEVREAYALGDDALAMNRMSQSLQRYHQALSQGEQRGEVR